MGYLKRSIDKIITGIDSPATRKSGTQRSLVSMSPMSGFYEQGESFDDGYNRAQNNPFNSPYSVRSLAKDGSWTPHQEEVEKKANSGMHHRRSWSGIVPGVIDTKNKNIQNERSYENFETFSAYENEVDSSQEIKKKKNCPGKKVFESSLENSEESFSNRIHFLESKKHSSMNRNYNNTNSSKQKSTDIGKSPQKQVDYFEQQPSVSNRHKKRSTLENYLESNNYQSPTNLGYSQQRVNYYDSPNSGKGSPMRMKNKHGNSKNWEVDLKSPQNVHTMNGDGLKKMVRELDSMHFGLDKMKESRTQGNLVLEEAEARLRKSFSSFKNIQYY